MKSLQGVSTETEAVTKFVSTDVYKIRLLVLLYFVEWNETAVTQNADRMST